MDYSGLPIPIGGSEPLSAVLQELRAQRQSRLANVPMSSQTIPTQNFVTDPNISQTALSSYNPITDFIPNAATSYHNPALSPYAPFGSMNAGLYPNIAQNNGIQIHEQIQGQQSGVYQQFSGLSNMPSQDHINLVHQMKRNHRKRLAAKQPLVENPGFNYPGYKPGNGVQRLNQYMLYQKNKPRDNNVQFWRSFVAEFFAPRAKKSWCVSSYKNSYQIGEDLKLARLCEMCNLYPCYGFEINENLLPELHKIRYDNGVLDENLHINAPTEYVDAYGQIILHFTNATEETEYHHTRIARFGQLRVVFSPDLKICSWEFCARQHKDYVPTNSLNPQAGQAVQNYQIAAGGDFTVPPPENMIVSSAYQMVEALGMSYLSQIGIISRYVQCLQISDMPNIMNEWMDYSLENATTQTGNMANFTCFGSKVPSEQLYQSPSAPYVSASVSAGPVIESGFQNRGLGNPIQTASTSMGRNNQKRQRISPNNPYVGFSSSLSSGHLNFSCAAPTPPNGVHPQLPHTPFGEAGQQSASANNLHMQPKNSQSDVDIYIERLRRVRQYDGVGFSQSQNGNIQNGSNALANTTNYGGNSSRAVYNVENYEVNDNNGVTSSALASQTTTSVKLREDVFPRDSESNYLPQEYDDRFLGVYMDFEELRELLE